MIKKSFLKLISLCLLLMMWNCKKEAKEDSPSKYKNIENWANLPEELSKTVDVFFVYPTIYNGTESYNMDIHDPSLQEKAQLAIQNQSGVFTDECNVYAPFYRQMSMQALQMSVVERSKYFEIGYNDVKQAFNYYIENLNRDRPFILAGHSQGTEVLIKLMKEEFSDDQLMEQLVAAYLIGYSVTEFELCNFPWMKMAQNAFDNGVIISYNTQASNVTGSPVLLPGARCTNPISWKTSNDYAGKEENLGAVFFDANGNVEAVIPQFTSARIDENGALVTDTPDPVNYYTPPFPLGIYHKFDYNFFYYNLKKNVSDRIRAYWENVL